MKKSIFKRLISIVVAVVMVFGVVSVGSYAAATPLFTLSDATTRQGEEFQITIKFNRAISSTMTPTAALDISLEYNSEIYTPVSMTMGDGLKKALNLIDGSDSNLENNYVYSASLTNPGVVKWSLLTINSFTFVKDETFMIVRFKANDLSDLNKNQNMKIFVTNAAAPNSLADITSQFGSYTNEMSVAANLSTLCDWEYVEALGGYRLVKFNGTNASTFTIPAEYDDPSDSRGSLPVASIGSGSFRNCASIEKITLSKNIVEVGSAAFMGCENLERVVALSDSTRFGANSLYGVSDDFVLKCIKDSTADEYAQKNDIRVEYFEDVADFRYEGLDEKLYYSGAPVKHTEIEVYNADDELKTYGVDYTYEYFDNVEIGKGKVIFTGLGECVGTHEIEFDVLCPYHNSESGYYTEVAVYTDCTQPGKIVKDCSYCEYHDESQEAPAKEHGELFESVETDSTCTSAGVMKHICKDCAQVIETSEIPMKAHDETSTEWIETAPATCEEPGAQVRRCVNCAHIVEEAVIPALEHNFVSKTIKEPTCSEKGSAGDVCENCGKVQNETELDIVEHDMEWVVTTEPTCTEKGVETYQCRFCGHYEGEVQTRELEAKGHEFGEWIITKEASCEEDGTMERACIHCFVEKESEVIVKLEHTLEWRDVVVLSCETDGKRENYCTACGEVFETVTTPKTGHTDGGWIIISEGSCLQDGHKTKYCTTCNSLLDEVKTPAPGHTDGDWEEIPATCAKEGVRNHYCAVCDEIYETTPIPSPAHTAGEWEIVFAADCINPGMKQKVCTVCGEAVDAQEIPATGHSNIEIITITLPSYKFEGKNRAVCKDCGVTIRDIPTRKLSADINGDGEVTSLDALYVLQYITGLMTFTPEQVKNANLDGRDTVSSSDALIILHIITGLI